MVTVAVTIVRGFYELCTKPVSQHLYSKTNMYSWWCNCVMMYVLSIWHNYVLKTTVRLFEPAIHDTANHILFTCVSILRYRILFAVRTLSGWLLFMYGCLLNMVSKLYLIQPFTSLPLFGSELLSSFCNNSFGTVRLKVGGQIQQDAGLGSSA